MIGQPIGAPKAPARWAFGPPTTSPARAALAALRPAGAEDRSGTPGPGPRSMGTARRGSSSPSQLAGAVSPAPPVTTRAAHRASEPTMWFVDSILILGLTLRLPLGSGPQDPDARARDRNGGYRERRSVASW